MGRSLRGCGLVAVVGLSLVLGTGPALGTPTTAATSGTPGVAERTVAVTAQARPLQDTFVTPKKPRRSFGRAARLATGPRAQALLAFRTPASDVSEAEIVDAELCVVARRASRPRLAVAPVTGGWSNRTTWRTRPRVASKTLTTWSSPVKARSRVCLALPTSAVEGEVTELALRGTRGAKGAVFGSRESARKLAPVLKVTVKGKPAPKPVSPTPSPEPTPEPSPEPTPDLPLPDLGTVLWDGAFEQGGIPDGRNGPECGTGAADGPNSAEDQYGSVEEMGNTACTNKVELTDELTRTLDSKRALKITMAAGQQREQLQSTYSWRPDDKGTVDEWYGFSLYYGTDWDLTQVSGSRWHNPVAFRMEGGNGSLNFSGDMDLNNGTGQPYTRFSTPHMILRRNTVMHNQGFYDDGLGLDKIDLGPIVTGEWMDFVCHVRWSTTATNALRECWRDGVHMGARTSVNAISSNKHTLRVGQYQATSIDHDRTTYVDNVRIGTSYAAVDPSLPRPRS
jgi:hypothetical protein